MHETSFALLSAQRDLTAAHIRVRARNRLGCEVVESAWGRQAGRELRAYILNAAANATNLDIERVADLSRATAIKESVFSKWFAGLEQPSIASLQKVATAINVPLRDLLVLARRVSASDLEMDQMPEPPQVLGHPLARELDKLLDADSPLSTKDKELLYGMVDLAVSKWRSSGRQRRSA